MTLSGTCILAAVAVLYRNLALLTSITTEDMKLNVLRITTMVNVTVMVTAIVLATLTVAGIVNFSEHGEKVFAMLLIAGVMIFVGIISPKLPL